MDVQFNPTPVFYIIIGVLVGMFIGWIIGFFDSNNRTAQKIKIAESKAEQKMMEAEEKLRQAEKLDQNASPAVARDDPGLLRIKNSNGEMLVEVDGMLLSKPLSSDRRKRLLDLINVFRPFLETPQAPTSTEAVPSTPATPRTPAVPVSTPVSTPAVKPVPVAFSTGQKKQTDPETEFKLLSMVQQIDTVLQKKLVGSPLEGEGIRLHDSPSGGLEVQIGLNKFETIDDVPDERIKTIIRAAIAEWEQKYIPGM